MLDNLRFLGVQVYRRSGIFGLLNFSLSVLFISLGVYILLWDLTRRFVRI